MIGYLRQYPPAFQFTAFIGLFIGFMLLYLLFLSTGFTAISGYTLETLQNGDLSDPKVIGYLKLTQFLYTLIVYLVPAAVFAYLTDPRPVAWLGIQRAPRLLPVALALLVMLCAFPAVGLSAEWNDTWQVPESARQLQQQADRLTRAQLHMTGIGSLLGNLLLIAVLPAIAEELFFRGGMQRLLQQMMPKAAWIAVIITAIIFSAVHMQFLGFMPRLLLGFLLGAIYYLTGNLWLSVLGHFLVNGLQVVMMYLYQYKYIQHDPMQTEPVQWYSAAISVLLTAGLLWLLRRRSPAPALVAGE